MDARQRYGVQASGACRIESKQKDPKITYAPEVPMSGFGAQAYAGDQAKSGPVQNGNGHQGSGEYDLSEGELKDLVGEVTRRIVESLKR
jgi:hypothetical protein